MIAKLLLLAFKNLRRNPLRALLTAMAMVLLASVFCMIATVLRGLNDFTAEKTRDVKMILTERYRIPSRFDRSLLDQVVRPGGTLHNELMQIPGFHPEQYTVWQFIGLTLDPEMRNKDLQFIAIATFPDKIPYMTDDLEELDPRVIQAMAKPPQSGLPNIGVLMPVTQMAKLNKKVGDVFQAKSFTHLEGGALRQPIELKFEVVGALPAKSRWAATFMDHAYLSRVLQSKKSDQDGKIDIGWLVVDDQEAAQQVSRTIDRQLRDLKCETLATAVNRWIAPMRDFLWGIEYVVAPAIMIVMVVIISNAVGITVRERTNEMAILKVLGYRKGQILALVLSEGAFIGALAGVVGGGVTQAIVHACGGIRLGDGAPFFVSPHAWWWGPALGAGTALLGGAVPAWNACRVKVSQVFARVA